MIKVEAIKEFSLKSFSEINNLVRYNPAKKESGRLYAKDTFECTKEMCKYLTGGNDLDEVVVRIIEVMPETKPKKRTSKK